MTVPLSGDTPALLYSHTMPEPDQFAASAVPEPVKRWTERHLTHRRSTPRPRGGSPAYRGLALDPVAQGQRLHIAGLSPPLHRADSHGVARGESLALMPAKKDAGFQPMPRATRLG